MRTSPPLLAALVLLAALPATASAKELAAAQACGASGCDDVSALATAAVLEGGPPTSAPARAAPFYRLRFTMRMGPERARFTTLYVPSLRLVRGDDGVWMLPPATTVTALDRLVDGRRPLPASRLPV